MPDRSRSKEKKNGKQSKSKKRTKSNLSRSRSSRRRSNARNGNHGKNCESSSSSSESVNGTDRSNSVRSSLETSGGSNRPSVCENAPDVNASIGHQDSATSAEHQVSEVSCPTSCEASVSESSMSEASTSQSSSSKPSTSQPSTSEYSRAQPSTSQSSTSQDASSQPSSYPPSSSVPTASQSNDSNDATGRFNRRNERVTPLRRCSELVVGQPYVVLSIARTNTQYGVAIRAELLDDRSPTGRSFVFLPVRFRDMPDADIQELNDKASTEHGLKLIYRGRVGRADMVELQ